MNDFIEIRQYRKVDFDNIFEIIHKTIEEIYPKYYPRNAIDFSIIIIQKEIWRNNYQMNLLLF
jgi:hypothetical protein